MGGSRPGIRMLAFCCLPAGCQHTTTHAAQRATPVQFPEGLSTAAALGSHEVTKAGVCMETTLPRWEMSNGQ